MSAVVLVILGGVVVFVAFTPNLVSAGHGTTIFISAVGKWMITAAAVLPATTIFLWIVARPARELLSAALRPPLRAAGFAAFIAAISTLAAYLLCRTAIPLLPGPQIIERGEWVEVFRTSGIRQCKQLAIVRRQDGTQITLCIDQGILFRTMRHDVDCLRRGDAVTVLVRSTYLGTSAILERARCR